MIHDLFIDLTLCNVAEQGSLNFPEQELIIKLTSFCDAPTFK